MDTSQEYARMCNCPEIQRIQHYSDDEFYRGFIDGKEVDTFLPRQDQLQEMLKNKPAYTCAWGQAQGFHEFHTRNLFPIDYSMEQLWLAFVMSELHSKVWRNNQWVMK